MAIVCGLDIHRSQVTFDWVDVGTGEGKRGRLAPANRETFRRWLEQFAGQDVDAKGLRELAEQHRVPESWIPPAQVLEIRTVVRLYHDLMIERAAWLHRIHATLFHQGALQQTQLLRGDRDRLHDSELLSPASKEAVQSILRVVEVLDDEINRIRQQLQRFAAKQPGCKDLQKEYGIGKLTSVIILE